MGHLDQSQHFFDNPRHLGLGAALRFKGEAHVLRDSHMGEKRVALEHRVHWPLVRRH